MIRFVPWACLALVIGSSSCSSEESPPVGDGGEPSSAGVGSDGAGSGGRGGSGSSGGGASSTAGAVGSAGEESGNAGETGVAGASTGEPRSGLSWPIDCVPDETCTGIGYPDADKDDVAFDCGDPGYIAHEGTDISISQAQMDAGVAVRAAADGEVWFVSDGKFDGCPNDDEPDCQNPGSLSAGAKQGTTVCTELGPYCKNGQGMCFWCFAGGNVVVVLHEGEPGVFATRYDHLKKGSVLVQPGDKVKRGQVLAQVGSAGNSTGPHLHFEVWGSTYYDVVEPWAGECGPNLGPSLWASEPAWE